MSVPSGRLLYDWQPNEADRAASSDLAVEYVIMERPSEKGGILVYSRYHLEWVENSWDAGPLISHLIQRLSEAEKGGGQ